MFNRNAGSKQVISPAFHDILLAAQAMALKTDGLYNPFVLPALQASGYVHSRVPGREQDTVDDHSRKSVTSIDRLEIEDNWARIPYGTALDLGGCGKGYLADQLRRDLPDIITGYWLSFGGDIAIGGNDEHKESWSVGIQSAVDQTKNIGTFTISRHCGVATSGITVHHGTKQGRQWHHLIDPRTRQPAETDILLATICDDSVLRADVLASCAVILGSDHCVPFLKRQGVRAAVMQCRSDKKVPRLLRFGNGIMIENNYA